MKQIARTWWLLLGLVSAAWLTCEPGVFTTRGFLPLRNLLVQYSGVLTICAMSAALFLAARPRLLERWFGGLDKMYRLHKWLGISVLVAGVVHWASSNAPKWASALGLLERGARGARAAPTDPLEKWLASFRGAAESIGEWAFYAAVLLIVVALVKWVPIGCSPRPTV